MNQQELAEIKAWWCKKPPPETDSNSILAIGDIRLLVEEVESLWAWRETVLAKLNDLSLTATWRSNVPLR